MDKGQREPYQFSFDWGTPDPIEQILWSFGHQDYQYCAEKVLQLLKTGTAQYIHCQLLIISLQRMSADKSAQQYGRDFLDFNIRDKWAQAALKLTLGMADQSEVLALAKNDIELRRTWYYYYSRAITTWRKQSALEALAQYDSINANVPEEFIIELERGHFALYMPEYSNLSASGVAFVDPRQEMNVFVSSTFRDLKEEREILAKDVFPLLRTLCETLGVVWRYVDLRWGVTDEQVAEGNVLPICLEAIDRCRPYFIGILGSRYGWCPEDFPPLLLEEYPWLSGSNGKSITEIEFQHGALNDPEVRKARFYFRTDDNIEEKIVGLRTTLANKNQKVVDFKTAKELKELVLADLIKTLYKDFSDFSGFTELDIEHAMHERFALNREENYVGCWKTLCNLDQYVLMGNSSLMVLGGGYGVSSLLACWGRRFRRAHPSHMVLLHFVGASRSSAHWPDIAKRILGEMLRFVDVDFPIPEDHEVLKKAIHEVAKIFTTPLVIVLDGLHEINPASKGRELGWLKDMMGEGIIWILSTSDEIQVDLLEKITENAMLVNPLQIDERRIIVTESLKSYNKKLSDKLVKKIVKTKATESPYYLRILIDELCLIKSHEVLPELIDQYLSNHNLEKLLIAVFRRWEKDYESNWPGLVGETLKRLWVCWNGLSEDVLLESLSLTGKSLPQRFWEPFFRAIDAYMNFPPYGLRLPNETFRNAVANYYLPSDSQKQEALITFSKLINKKPMETFINQAIELFNTGVKLKEAGQNKEAGSLFAKIGKMFASKGLFDRAALAHHSSAYAFQDADEPMTALVNFRLAEIAYQKDGDEKGLLKALTDRAVLNHSSGNTESAMKCYIEAETLACKLCYPEFWLITLFNQAKILLESDLDEAVIKIQKAMELVDEYNIDGQREAVAELYNNILNRFG